MSGKKSAAMRNIRLWRVCYFWRDDSLRILPSSSLLHSDQISKSFKYKEAPAPTSGQLPHTSSSTRPGMVELRVSVVKSYLNISPPLNPRSFYCFGSLSTWDKMMFVKLKCVILAGITGWTGRIWSLNFLPKGLYPVAALQYCARFPATVTCRCGKIFTTHPAKFYYTSFC